MITNELKINDKYLLTIKEAAQYFNVGENKLRELTSADNCAFAVWVGIKRLINRKKCEEFFDKEHSI